MADSDKTTEELKKEIEKILKVANLETMSTDKVIKKLEKIFGTSLTSKKTLIDQLVMDYVNNLSSSESEEEAEASTSEKEEEKEKTPPPKKEDDEEWGAGKRKGKKADDKKKTPAKGKKAGGVKKRGKGSGYTRPYKLSPELSELLGEKELPRHEVVKRVWNIIKERQLFDPNNRQFAICDKPLYKVIGTKRFFTFGMMKYLKNHFLDD